MGVGASPPHSEEGGIDVVPPLEEEEDASWGEIGENKDISAIRSLIIRANWSIICWY
jgi:hypothetical protein